MSVNPITSRGDICERCGLSADLRCSLPACPQRPSEGKTTIIDPQLLPPFQHTRSCPALTPLGDACTCGLYWRIRLSTEITMHAAWRKRAEEAEEAETSLRSATERLTAAGMANFAAQLASLRSYEALLWAANWVLSSATDEPRVKEFANNMATTIRAEAESRKNLAVSSVDRKTP